MTSTKTKNSSIKDNPIRELHYIEKLIDQYPKILIKLKFTRKPGHFGQKKKNGGFKFGSKRKQDNISYKSLD